MHAHVVTDHRDSLRLNGIVPRASIARPPTLVYSGTLLTAGLLAAVSSIGIAMPWLHAADSVPAFGLVTASGGVLVPGLGAHDIFNLLVAVPLLLALPPLSSRGSLAALLLWPGALFYVVYTAAISLFGAPFGPLFLAHVALVASSATSTIGLLVQWPSQHLARRLSEFMPAHTIAGLLIALAALTFAQDTAGVLTTLAAGASNLAPVARGVWSVDLAIEVPVVLATGILLWRRAPLGYAAAPGVLLQFGLTPLALAFIISLQPLLTGAALDVGLATGVLAFAIVCFAPLAFLKWSARSHV